MLPSLLRWEALIFVSQLEPSPHSRWTAPASVESQKPAHVPLSGTHCFGPVSWPERSTQEKPLAQSAPEAHLIAQNVSCDWRFRTHRSPGPPHSRSPAQGAHSGRAPRQLPTVWVPAAGRQRPLLQAYPAAQPPLQLVAQNRSPLLSAWQTPLLP